MEIAISGAQVKDVLARCLGEACAADAGPIVSANLASIQSYRSNLYDAVNMPAVLVYVLGGPVGRVSSVAFIGVSLILQAARADGGCEVMSIPAVLFGKRTHLVCIAFSPIDWIEERLAERRSG